MGTKTQQVLSVVAVWIILRAHIVPIVEEEYSGMSTERENIVRKLLFTTYIRLFKTSLWATMELSMFLYRY